MNPVVHVLTLVLAAGAAPVEIAHYDSAVECDIAVRTVKIHHRGARLRCVPHPASPEEHQARALARLQ